MGRPPRCESATGIHHVMNRGVDHQPIFFSDVDRLEFGRRLAEIFERLEVVTLAYCLMGNHFHLVLRAPPGVLPQAMHHLTSVYSHFVNRRIGRDGPLFRGRYHAIAVESDGYLLWVVRYVHRNPLDIVGVTSPEEYRWSSHRAYLGLRPAPLFLDREPVLGLVGGDTHELEAITVGRAAPMSTTAADLIALVRCAQAVADLAPPLADAASPRADRTLLTLFAARTADREVREAARTAIGPRSSAAERHALRRAEARRIADPAVDRALRWVERQLGTGIAA